jgi:hypothetical protein
VLSFPAGKPTGIGERGTFMNRHSLPHAACLLALLAGISLLPGTGRADTKDADKKAELKPEGTLSGLMTDFKDGYMMVQLDDRDEPIKFLFGPGMTIQTLTKQQGIFPCNRINLKYKTDGDDKKVLAAEKVPGRQNGIVIGKVIKVYNNFWVSVKPENGMIEGFALGGAAKNAGDVLKSLKPGDLVAIKYTTDGERHRIAQIEVKPAAEK